MDIKQLFISSFLRSINEYDDLVSNWTDVFLSLVIYTIPRDNFTRPELITHIHEIIDVPEVLIDYSLDRAIQKSQIKYNNEEKRYYISLEHKHKFSNEVISFEARMESLLSDMHVFFKNNYIVETKSNIADHILNNFFILLDDNDKEEPTVISEYNNETSTARMINKYILKTIKNNPSSPNIKFLREIFQCLIIKESLEGSCIKTGKGSFFNCKMFFDAKITFSLLGLYGEESRKHFESFFNTLKDCSFQLYVFDFTTHLIRKIVLSYFDKTGGGIPYPLYLKFRENKWSKQDAVIYLNELEDKLTNMGISILNTSADFQNIDPDVFSMSDHFFSTTRPFFSKSSRDLELIHNFYAIKKISELRGDTYTQIDNPKAMFLTTNNRLAKYNYKIKKSNVTNILPETLLYTDIVTLLWLFEYKPKQKEIPLSTIIAAYSNNLMIDSSSWKRFNRILQKQLSENDIKHNNIANLFYKNYLSEAMNQQDDAMLHYEPKIFGDQINFPKIMSRLPFNIRYRTRRSIAILKKYLLRKKDQPCGYGDRKYAVWFCTDRMPNFIDKNHFTFLDVRSHNDKLRYGICHVYVPISHDIGSLGSPLWKRILNRIFLRPADEPLEIQERLWLTEPDYWKQMKNHLQGKIKEEKTAMIYIHGFNVGFEEATLRAAQIGKDLKIPLMAYFSWPSLAGGAKDYVADGNSIVLSRESLTEFLARFSSNSGAEKVHILAHSMGSRVLYESIITAVHDAEQSQKIPFGQIFLAAPDIDRRYFLRFASLYSEYSERTTMYISGKDNALEGSGLLANNPRAGFKPPITIVNGIDTIDTSDVDFTLLGHGYYANAKEVLYDMDTLMKYNTDPDKRFGLTSVQLNDQKYWEMKH